MPGEISGYWLAHKIGGRLPWKKLFEPAINLSKNGFPVSSVLAESLKLNKDKISKSSSLITMFTNPATNQLYKTNEIIKYPKLASTLEKISENGVEAFYNGELSGKIISEINLKGK